MTIPSVFKFINWITGTPTPIEDGVASAFTAPIASGVTTAFDAFIKAETTAVFGASGASHSLGIVPDPGAVAGTTKFLREDATWQTITILPFLAPGGRLTLTSGSPVLAATVSAASTVYYSPYIHQYVPLYDGSVFTGTDIGGELSQTTADATKSPAAMTTNSNYDIFVWSDSGTIRATRGPVWTSDTARGAGAGTSELVRTKGVLLNANAITNGPAASRGTYVGTVRSNGTSTVDWIFGGSANGGTAGFFAVWNCYNRIRFDTLVNDNTATWNYNLNAFRSSDASTGNRVSIIRGLNEDSVLGTHCGRVSTPAANAETQIGIGLDSVTVLSGTASDVATNSININIGPARYSGIPGLGWHFFQAIEKQINGGITTFVGGVEQGLTLSFMA